MAQQRQKVEAEKGVKAKEPRVSPRPIRKRSHENARSRVSAGLQRATGDDDGKRHHRRSRRDQSGFGQRPTDADGRTTARHYRAKPKEALADGGFATKEDIHTLHEEHQVQVYAPVKDENKKREAGVDPFVPRKGDPEGVALWRRRMGTEAATDLCRTKPARTAEWANAGMRNRGLYQFRVPSGLTKVKAVVLWYVLAHNLLQAVALQAAATAATKLTAQCEDRLEATSRPKAERKKPSP